MNNHHFSRFLTAVATNHLRTTLILACCSMGSIVLHAQKPAGEQYGVRIAVDSYTIAEPGYGASCQYSWEDIHACSREGKAVPMKLDLEMIQNEGGGLFTVLSQPIMVPEWGMHIAFDRHVVIRPSDAERGTSLPNDPQDKCKNQKDGTCRVVFHHRVAVVDAETGEVLKPRVDDHRFDVSRYKILNDIDDMGEVVIDLDAFANRQVRLRAIVLMGYNGRGPTRSTVPAISTISSGTGQGLH